PVGLSTEHRELVSKDDDLELLEVLGAGTKQDELQQGADQQVAEREEQEQLLGVSGAGARIYESRARSRAGNELKHHQLVTPDGGIFDESVSSCRPRAGDLIELDGNR